MRRALRALTSLLLIAFGSGCASTPDPTAMDPALRNRLPSVVPIHVIAYPSEPPPLTTWTAATTGGLFGGLGGVIVMARAAKIGQELMEKHHVQPLSALLAAALIEELKPTLPGLQRAMVTPASDDPDVLKATGLRPLILDVESAGDITFYESNRHRYRLMYTGRVRLVDTEQGRVLWRCKCKLKGTEFLTPAPTLDALEADDGVAYRRLVNDTTIGCVREIVRQYRATWSAPARTLSAVRMTEH